MVHGPAFLSIERRDKVDALCFVFVFQKF